MLPRCWPSTPLALAFAAALVGVTIAVPDAQDGDGACAFVDASCTADEAHDVMTEAPTEAAARRGGALLQTSSTGSASGKPHASKHHQSASAIEKPVSLLKGKTGVTKKFIEDWQAYFTCCTDCAEQGEDAPTCASTCYQLMSTASPPAPPPNGTAVNTTPPGPPWQTCCKRYTATCLACVMEVSVAEFCDNNENLQVPGCAQVMQAELYEERRRNGHHVDSV